MFLDEILAKKREEVEQEKKGLSQEELLNRLKIPRPRRDFKARISEPSQINLIAEVKYASPSRGIIREDFDPVEIAKSYEANGARALSVLTDEKFFKGNLSYLSQIREVTTLPILRKDFIIDEYQIYQSALAGSDAILLISAILSKEEIARFYSITSGLNLDCLVEVHTEEEVARVLGMGPQIIGINNRDLATFEVNLETTERLIGMIPKDKIIVAESGISSHEDVARLRDLGVNAVLIGEVFMESEDIASKVKEVMGYRSV